MQLHRASGTPDWARLQYSQMNRWQRLAFKTGGICTPGNVISLIGFALVLLGLAMLLAHHYGLGAGLLIIGRLLDIADGWVANATQTKSPLGEVVDASFDKLTTLLTVVALFIEPVAPRWVLLAVLLPHILIVLAALLAYVRGKRLHPSALGKVGMAMVWFSLIGFVLVKSALGQRFGFLHLIVNCMAGLAIGMGSRALIEYVRPRI